MIKAVISTYGLDVVADLLCDQLGDVLDEGVLDADLVAVWEGDRISRASPSMKRCELSCASGTYS